MRYGSVESMVKWLDREAIAAARERRYRNRMRHMRSGQRRFVRVLRHVLELVPGPENLQPKKIMEALQIGPRMHQKRLAEVRKTLV